MIGFFLSFFDGGFEEIGEEEELSRVAIKKASEQLTGANDRRTKKAKKKKKKK